MKKEINAILSPPAPHMVGDGFRVHNFFPSGYRVGNLMSPFILMDYNAKIEFPASDHQRGVGVHPHRGFETVTVVFDGKIAHHDSSGNSGVIGKGDVQWMTAGSGILHKEYHDKAYSNAGGEFHMAQLWVNLPAKDKMTDPKYQDIRFEDQGVFELENNKGSIHVIAGEYNGAKGPATTFSPIQMYATHAKEGATLDFSFPELYNTGILVLEGEVVVNDDETAPTDHFIVFKNKGTDISLKATANTKLLVLSGEPIKEPMIQYGPFVMNTKEEIQQAYDDLAKGKFGHLED